MIRPAPFCKLELVLFFSFLWSPYWLFLPLNIFFNKNLAILFQLNNFNHKSFISSLWNKLYHHNCLFETLCQLGLALSSICLVSSKVLLNSSNKILLIIKSFNFCLNIYSELIPLAVQQIKSAPHWSRLEFYIKCVTVKGKENVIQEGSASVNLPY